MAAGLASPPPAPPCKIMAAGPPGTARSARKTAVTTPQMVTKARPTRTSVYRIIAHSLASWSGFLPPGSFRQLDVLEAIQRRVIERPREHLEPLYGVRVGEGRRALAGRDEGHVLEVDLAELVVDLLALRPVGRLGALVQQIGVEILVDPVASHEARPAEERSRQRSRVVHGRGRAADEQIVGSAVALRDEVRVVAGHDLDLDPDLFKVALDDLRTLRVAEVLRGGKKVQAKSVFIPCLGQEFLGLLGVVGEVGRLFLVIV